MRGGGGSSSERKSCEIPLDVRARLSFEIDRHRPLAPVGCQRIERTIKLGMRNRLPMPDIDEAELRHLAGAIARAGQQQHGPVPVAAGPAQIEQDADFLIGESAIAVGHADLRGNSLERQLNLPQLLDSRKRRECELILLPPRLR